MVRGKARGGRRTGGRKGENIQKGAGKRGYEIYRERNMKDKLNREYEKLHTSCQTEMGTGMPRVRAPFLGKGSSSVGAERIHRAGHA